MPEAWRPQFAEFLFVDFFAVLAASRFPREPIITNKSKPTIRLTFESKVKEAQIRPAEYADQQVAAW